MSLPDEGQVEAYTEAEFAELLKIFETDKGKLSKKQQAAVARYNFKKGKNEPILYKGQGAPPAAAGAPSPAAAPAAAGVSVDAATLAALPADMQALAARDPATLSKDEKIALAKAKSQAVKAAQAAKDAGAAAPAAEEGPKGPTPEEIARGKALAFPLSAKLDAKFAASAAIEAWSMQVDKPYATVKAERIFDVLRYAKQELGFDYILNLTAVDYPPDRMEVVYNVFHSVKREHLALRAKVPRAAPEGQDLPSLPSVTPLYKGADWLEREVFDLFGIRFTGHPYMRRLMMPDGWVGHPLRKDYDSRKEQFVGLGSDGNDIVSFDPKDGW